MINEVNYTLGATYSVEIYESYRKTKDAEIFEEVVQDLILNKYSDSMDLNEFIRSLSKQDKRLAIMSLIDKETKGDANLMWSEMKAYVDSRIDKMEHVKDVIRIINKFVKDGYVEKKNYGEVMTPIPLVLEMLDTLPKEVWSNPNLKWLDPSNGAGTFPFVLIYKLMNGLKGWQEDVELRYKHIVENMIYTCELQSRNVFLWLCGVDPKDEFTTNTYWGSFLDEGFDYHMKNVWGVDKFDIILGNPPYQELSVSKNKMSDQGRIKLWMRFINKSLNICEFLLFITPNNWLSKTCYLNSLFQDKLIHAEIDSAYLNSFFNGVGSTFSYYLLSNKKRHSICFTSSKKKIDYNLLELDLLPTKDITYDTISVFKKLQSKKLSKINFTRENYSRIADPNLCISIDRSKNRGFEIINMENALSTSSYWYQCRNELELECLLHNLNSTFYRFIVKNIRSGMAIVSSINSLPILFDRKYTDQDIFSLFDLSIDEINCIKSIITK